MYLSIDTICIYQSIQYVFINQYMKSDNKFNLNTCYIVNVTKQIL